MVFKRNQRFSRRLSGLSLIEIVVALAVVGVLATIAVPGFHQYRKYAEKAVCMSHMRTIHGSLGMFLAENHRWPQMPESALGWDESTFFAWWQAVLEPYGSSGDTWMCPADKLDIREMRKEKIVTGSYIPTLFDGRQLSPIKWPQPWLMERGNLHGKGAHIAMPDGSIHDSFMAFPGR